MSSRASSSHVLKVFRSTQGMFRLIRKVFMPVALSSWKPVLMFAFRCVNTGALMALNLL